MVLIHLQTSVKLRTVLQIIAMRMPTARQKPSHVKDPEVSGDLLLL